MTQAASDDVVDDVEVDTDEQAEGQETEQTEQPEEGQPEEQGTDTEGGATDETDEVVVSIGEDPPPSDEDEIQGKPAPAWVKDLRERNREQARELRELRAKVAKQTAEPETVKLGAKPTLEACDFDADRFERELTAWHERKRTADEQERKKQQDAEQEQRAWQARLDAYGTAKAGLKVKDFDDAEAATQTLLSTTQQGVILHGADNPALLVYALGKNPKRAKELASINDPVKFAFAVAKLEKDLKVTPRKAAPLPEKTVRGATTGGAGGAVDSTLERLRAEAGRTGNLSKVLAYQRQQREKQRS